MKTTNEVLQQLVLNFVSADDIKSPETAIKAALATTTTDYDKLSDYMLLDLDQDYLHGLLPVGRSQAVFGLSAGLICQGQRVYMTTLPNRNIVLYVTSTDGYHVNNGPKFTKVRFTVFSATPESVDLGMDYLISCYQKHGQRN